MAAKHGHSPSPSEGLARELYQAVEARDNKRVNLLLKEKADPNQPLYWSDEWKYKSPPLHHACLNGYLDIVTMLLDGGADVFKSGGQLNSTPLHYASLGGHKQVVEYLIKEAGCKVDVRDNVGETPLHYACRSGNRDLVQYLVKEVKCDVGIKSSFGDTPCDLAAEYGRTEIVDYVKSVSSERSHRGKKGTSSENHDSSQHPSEHNASQAESAHSVSHSATGTPSSTPLSEEEFDALQRLLRHTKVKLPSSPVTLERVQQLLLKNGHNEIATNLRAKLDKEIRVQQQRLKRLEELLKESGIINLRYLKTFLVGPPGVGKTTTLNRLLKTIVNIISEGDKRCESTLLANCYQVFAVVSSSGSDWISSTDLNHETKLLFRYLCGCKLEEVTHKQMNVKTRPQEERFIVQVSPKPLGVDADSATQGMEECRASNTEAQNVRILDFVTRLQELIKSGDESTLMTLVGSTLLNINDIGGQPGFLEMLPALSTGPAMYFLFFNISKELDKPYKIPFSREDTTITPFDALHTVEAALSQILSAISSVHCTTQESSRLNVSKATEFGEKFEKFESFRKVQPVAALIGTHKDELKEDAEQKLETANKSLNEIVCRYSKTVARPSSNRCFFAVDNYAGIDRNDISPIRDFMSEIFQTHFKEASLPIRPKWLWLSLILRREYKVVSRTNCIELARLFGMDEDEIDFSLWYLHHFTGTLMYYPDIPDEWFKNHIICSPQVIFDSISQLILASLRTLHTEGAFLEFERQELIKNGQFSLESIEKYCASYHVKKKLQNFDLIPTNQLIKLLNHVNLLSPITHTEADGSKRVTYFMPAILECTSLDKLTTPPPPDANNPEPLYITFECGYVPTGTFCGLITRLVTLGPDGIIGLRWELVEKGVKRNCVSFTVAKSNKVTLISHDKCFEIRVTRQHRRIDVHDLCSHVLSVIQHTLKSLYKQLITHIAFQCPCPDHESSRGVDHLCVLTDDSLWIQFLCGSNPVNLRKYQEIWFGDCVTPGSCAELEVLKFAEEDVSFCWTKEGSRRQIKTTSDEPNILIFRSVREEDLGYYRCEVKETGRLILTVYKALYREESTTSSIEHPPSGENKDRDKSSLRSESSGVNRKSTSGAHGTVPLEELLRKYSVSSEQLDCEIEEGDMPYLASHFDNVELYPKVLGLDAGEQNDVRLLVPQGTQIAMSHCLLLWRRRNPSQATLRALLKILLRLGKGEIASNVCSYYCPRSKQQKLEPAPAARPARQFCSMF